MFVLHSTISMWPQAVDSGQRKRCFTFWKLELSEKGGKRTLMLIWMWVKCDFYWLCMSKIYPFFCLTHPLSLHYNSLQSSGSAAGSTKQKKPNIKAKTSALNFDYFNSPENVEWVLTDPSEGSWTPFIGKVEVPESVRQDWAAAFTDLTTSNNGSKICWMHFHCTSHLLFREWSLRPISSFCRIILQFLSPIA